MVFAGHEVAIPANSASAGVVEEVVGAVPMQVDGDNAGGQHEPLSGFNGCSGGADVSEVLGGRVSVCSDPDSAVEFSAISQAGKLCRMYPRHALYDK